jgi:hypothetical protein
VAGGRHGILQEKKKMHFTACFTTISSEVVEVLSSALQAEAAETEFGWERCIVLLERRNAITSNDERTFGLAMC